jgi:phosphoribosylformylglycinamidine (FGAM) synthase-like enzyme
MAEVPARLDGDPEVTPQLAREHGLSDEEYGMIERWLDRKPTFTELGVFSVMWSEHCSYKSSRRYLRMLPSKGAEVATAAGENAGAVRVGDGWVAVFKIESHNHPSYVEPYQGAATGVGGIIRDILAMGARPVATLDSLRFGALDAARMAYLVRGVVGGIGGYGNCVGVPTVGGEVGFDPAYNKNILVNAFCLGLAQERELASAAARLVDAPLIYAGSATGRDGIHGASLLASAEFGAAAESKRPTVQVGDPFAEKLLIEACLEALKSGAIVALQDMGAAGLTSSSSEMAGRAGLGVELNLDSVPLREPGLSPYEILLSESQERMLLAVYPGRESEVLAAFGKWDVNACVIGRITPDGRWRVWRAGALVANIPVCALTTKVPSYDRLARPPVSAGAQSQGSTAAPGIAGRVASEEPPASTQSAPLIQGEKLSRLPASERALPGPPEILRALLDSPNIASKRWVFRQYDYLVQSNTVVGPGSDAAVLRVKGTKFGLALAVDSNPRACARDPYLGAVATVCEAARNVACVGARPLGISDCLNYGNPERPEIMWQFIRGIEGIRDAAQTLGIPVVSGNVSFYNETEGQAIPPTPTIAVVGRLDDVRRRVSSFFQCPGDVIGLVKSGRMSLAASEYEACFGVAKQDDGDAVLAEIDLKLQKTLLEALAEAADRGLLSSAHDVSCGGVAVALAEACFGNEEPLGAEVIISGFDGLTAEQSLFAEGTSLVVLSYPHTQRDALDEIFTRRGLGFEAIGRVSAAPRLKIGSLIDEDCRELQAIYERALPRRLDRDE